MFRWSVRPIRSCVKDDIGDGVALESASRHTSDAKGTPLRRRRGEELREEDVTATGRKKWKKRKKGSRTKSSNDNPKSKTASQTGGLRVDVGAPPKIPRKGRDGRNPMREAVIERTVRKLDHLLREAGPWATTRDEDGTLLIVCRGARLDMRRTMHLVQVAGDSDSDSD